MCGTLDIIYNYNDNYILLPPLLAHMNEEYVYRSHKPNQTKPEIPKFMKIIHPNYLYKRKERKGKERSKKNISNTKIQKPPNSHTLQLLRVHTHHLLNITKSKFTLPPLTSIKQQLPTKISLPLQLLRLWFRWYCLSWPRVLAY